ncbi:MAG: ATP-binding protein [Deltaproteobacteria bacterium]|nr:ATP-binding protein [Deltaproteobacteria bacterium]
MAQEPVTVREGAVSDAAIGGEHRLLTAKQLHGLQDLTDQDQPGNWKAVEILVDHLEDELVLVASSRVIGSGFGEINIGQDWPPCRLVAATANDRGKTGLYVMVTTAGWVIVGRADNLGAVCEPRRLNGFDPLWDHVVSVAVTNQQRRVGLRSDLWIVVRRIPQDTEEPFTVVAYHGLVWLEADRPRLEPAADDMETNGVGGWQGIPDPRLPTALEEWNFSTAAGIDPFAGIPEKAAAEARAVLARARRGPQAVAWDGSALCLAVGDEIIRLYCEADDWQRASLSVESVTAIAVCRRDLEVQTRGIAGCDHRQLIAFCGRYGATEELWRQRVGDSPVALAFLPPSDDAASRTRWPDLMVAFSDGRLNRLQYVGRDLIRERWEACWQHLRLDSAEERIKAARTDGLSDSQRRPLLVAVVESVLKEADRASPQQRADLVAQVAGLVSSTADPRVQSPAVAPLLQALERRISAADPPRLLPDGVDFIPALLWSVYSNQAPLAIREQIDRTVRALSWPTAPSDPAFEQLQQRARRNRDDVWHGAEPRGIDDLIERVTFGLERWVNTYLPADTFRFGISQHPRDVVGLASVSCSVHGRTGERWLAAAERNSVTVTTLDRSGRVKLPHSMPVFPDMDNDVIRSVLRVRADKQDRLLLVSGSGSLYVYALASPGNELRCVQKLQAPPGGNVTAAATCPANADSALIAVVLRQQHRSHLCTYLLVGSSIQPTSEQILDLADVSAIDLSTDGAGAYRLIACTGRAGPAVLYRLDQGGRLTSRRWLWALGTGALAVRFSASNSPQFAVVGARDGLLWCADLSQQSEVQRLAWTCRLDGGIRSVDSVSIDGQPYFLTGTEDGNLDLVRASDGGRIWTHQIDEPVRQLVVMGEPDGLAIGALTSAGALSVFSRVTAQDREATWKKVVTFLEQLHAQPIETTSPAWARPPAEAARAIYDLQVANRPFSEILPTCRTRDARILVLRFLAERAVRVPAEITELIEKLTPRQLRLVLYHVPDTQHGWDGPLRTELQRRISAQGSTPRDLDALAVLWLQRIGRRQRPVSGLRAAQLDAKYFAFPWFCTEFARLLLQAAQREVRGDGGLLRHLVPDLIELPPSLIAACLAVLPWDSAARRDFEAVSAILEGTEAPVTPSADILDQLATALRPAIKSGPTHLLLSALVGLHRCHGQLYPDAQWVRHREAALSCLRKLAETAYSLTGAEGALSDLIAGLRSILPRDQLPADQDLLSARAGWIATALHALDRKEVANVQPIADRGQWLPYAVKLVERTRGVLRDVLECERRYVTSLVRPRVAVGDCALDESNRVRLRVRVTPEGTRQLRDVSLLFDAETDHQAGLSLPGQTKARLDLPEYPGRTASHEVQLSGYILPGQRAVSVGVRLVDRSGFRSEETWQLPLPEPRRIDQLTLALAVPRAYEAFCEAIRQSTAQVVLAVLDADLGRESFITDCRQRLGFQQLDLDGVVRDQGDGRRYSARPLDAPLIEERARGLVDDLHLPPGNLPPLLFAPVDELIQRLVDGESPGTLGAGLAALRDWAEQRQGPRVIVLISSLHACRLRPLGLGPIQLIAGHAPHDASESASGAQLHTELSALAAKELRIGEVDATKLVARLGGDPRLVLRHLRWTKTRDGRSREGLTEFLARDDVANLLKAELAALDAFDLIATLAGAEAATSLKFAEVAPGHVSADTHRSSTITSAPKMLQQTGETFTKESLDRLSSDRSPPQFLRVEGFGTAGTAEGGRCGLTDVILGRSKERREKTFRHLADLGIGTWLGSVFRTVSPYRELIRRLYDAIPPGPQRDTAVYAKLVGPDRSPAEAVSPTDLVDLSEPDLQRLMPQTTREDLRCLRRLARVWAGQDDDEVERAVRELFRGDSATRLPAASADWDAPLAGVGALAFRIAHAGAAAGDGGHTHVLWTGDDSSTSLDALSGAVDAAEAQRTTIDTRRKEEARAAGKVRGDEGDHPPCRVMVIGSRAQTLGLDPSRKLAVFGLRDLIDAAWVGSMKDNLIRKARAQLRLSAFSPFQTAGSLPPGSRLFFGRDDELDFIRVNIRRTSILVVGCRRVGKTSLLNQVRYWAQTERDLLPIYVNLEGVGDRNSFIAAVDTELKALTPQGTPQLNAGLAPREALRVFGQELKGRGMIPVFLLNEVDELVEKDSPFIHELRGMNDDGLARFVMVGYSVISRLASQGSPFYHFTEGSSFDRKAIVLTALSRDAGRKLLGQLEGGDLQLKWRSEAEGRAAYDTFLDRSYCIPWVLQTYGRLLVERLEADRREVLTKPDAEAVVGNAPGEDSVVWRFIENIRYDGLGYREASEEDERTSPRLRPETLRAGFQLVLFAVARQRYFLGGARAPIRDRRLSERSPLDKDLGFTVADARGVVKDTIRDLLRPSERPAIEDWFDRLDLEQALRLLTLTLMLEPDPAQYDRYGFLLHIVPMELARKYADADPTLDGRIVQKTTDLIECMR